MDAEDEGSIITFIYQSVLHSARCKLGWVGGLKSISCGNYTVKNNTYTQKLKFYFKFFVLEQFWSVSVFKSILFSTNEYRIGAYLQDLMSSVETYHFLTLGVGIFFSHLCKLSGGWVGQSEFALCANWKNRTRKWTTPN